MTSTMKDKPADTATYKPLRCYCCGETMKSYTFSDVWDMRIDGKLHKVPVLHIPCHRCDSCDLAVIDGGSDDAVMWSYKKYIKERGLNTPWLSFRRQVRRFVLRIVDRWNYWTYKTFYRKNNNAG